MALIHRNKAQRTPGNSIKPAEEPRDDKMKEHSLSAGFKFIVAASLILLLVVSWLFSSEKSALRESGVMLKENANGNSLFLRKELSKDSTLLLQMESDAESESAITLGPHAVQLVIKNKACKFPRFWMRLTGDALVYVDLSEDPGRKSWSGSFSLPVAGSYNVDTRWYGCNGDETEWTPLSNPLQLQAVGSATPHTSQEEDSLFKGSSWLSKHSMKLAGPELPEYLWMNPEAPPTGESFVNTSDSIVLREGTVRQPGGFYKFKDLGNYELLCFMGNQTMVDIRREFLEMRPQLFSGQRPFKFHMYNIGSFVKPDRHWIDDTKKSVRKCKHILVSLDELIEPISQSEYREQVKTFIGHLLKLMNDDTFPIWMFTFNEPPMNATQCHSPDMPRTTDHPCNDVLKELFRTGTFPSRVHLLDNTDLSLPQFDEHRTDVLAVIALRVYVFVGKRVAEWRAMGQHGLIDGLHRNGTVEPNFELVPYEGWS